MKTSEEIRTIYISDDDVIVSYNKEDILEYEDALKKLKNTLNVSIGRVPPIISEWYFFQSEEEIQAFLLVLNVQYNNPNFFMNGIIREPSANFSYPLNEWMSVSVEVIRDYADVHFYGKEGAYKLIRSDYYYNKVKKELTILKIKKELMKVNVND